MSSISLVPSKADLLQNVFPPRANIYLTGVVSGQIVNLNRVFKGVGALLAYTVPLTSAAAQVVQAILLPPEGPRANGFPLRARLFISDIDSGEIDTDVHDVVVFET